MIKKRMGALAAIAGIAIVLLASCGNGNTTQNEPEIKKETHDAKSTDLVKFNNVTNAKYLATQWAPKAEGRFARAGELDAEDTLLAVVEKTDDNGEVVKDESGEPILEEAEVLEVPTEELKLCDWCVLQPVREIYQCPYNVPEAEAMGVYTVFAGYIDWWKYTDDTPAPGISMLMYVKPDGAVVDVLNVEGNVKYYCATWQKENDGEDYIQFDENGNLFVLAHDDTNDKFILFRYNPINSQLNQYELDIKGSTKTNINNFKITKDGKWVFLNVMIDDKQNNVYAMEVSSNKLISMYEYKAEIKTGETTYAVSSIGVNPLTNLVYWYVDEYSDPLRPNSGLYVATKGTNGYSKDSVSRYNVVNYWDLNVAVQKYLKGRDITNPAVNADESPVKAADNPDYAGLLAYLKNACGYKGDVELSLSYFKNLVIENKAVEWGGNTIDKLDLTGLYAEANGKALTDEAALKYIFENNYYDIYKDKNAWNLEYYKADPKDWDTANGEDWSWTTKNLFYTSLNDFYYYYWSSPHDWIDSEGKTQHALSGYGEAEKEKYIIPYGDTDPTFPLGILMFKKGTTTPAYPSKDGMDEAYVKSLFSKRYNGIILSNDEGTWVLSDVWDPKQEKKDDEAGKPTGNNSHSIAYQLTDSKGNFVCAQSGDLADKLFKPRWDYDLAQRDDTDPWYKKPFAANSNGIAAISKDQKTIYYHSKGVTTDLLAKDKNKSQVAAIYAFNLYDDVLIYNAVNKNGGYLMISIDLETGTATKLPIEKKVESMLGL